MKSSAVMTLAGHASLYNPNLDTCAGNDLAVLGNGFFVLRDPQTGALYATQSGRFILDDDGYLVTVEGTRLQGRINGVLSAVGDIQIHLADLAAISGPQPSLVCYSIDAWGKITMHLTDGTSLLRGQVMLQNFEEPQALVCEGADLYSNLSAAGPLPALAAPGTLGLGLVQSDVPELSGADAAIWRN